MPVVLTNQVHGSAWLPVGTFAAMGAASVSGVGFLCYRAADDRYYTDQGTAVRTTYATTADGVTQNAYPTSNSTPGYGVALGSDGNLWWAAFYDDGAGTTGPAIQRMTPAGVYTENHTLTSAIANVPSSVPAIFAGPSGDDSLYLLTGNDQIARFAISGFGTASARAWLAAAGTLGAGGLRCACIGPDNLIWSCGSGTQALLQWSAVGGASAPTSTVKNASVATTAIGNHRKLLTGPDSNLWLLGNKGWMVYSTAGTLLATYLFTTTTGTANDGCVGPDGALWATLSGATNRLVRCDTSGTLSEYPITTNTTPLGICAGGDNVSLWFTSQATKKFIKFT